MEDKIWKKVTAMMMIAIEALILVPAQELRINKEYGKIRLEQYMDRARRERSEERWQRLAEEGVFAALEAWESANVYIKEKDEQKWKRGREEAEAEYKEEKEKSQVQWIIDRYYEEKEIIERQELAGELRELGEKWEYEKESGEKSRQIRVADVKAAKLQWKAVSETLVRMYEKEGEEKIRAKELEELLEGLDIGEAEKKGVLERNYEEYERYLKKEYEQIWEAEQNELMGELLYDRESMKKKSASQAATVIAQELAAEAKAESEKAVTEVFGKFESTIGDGEKEALEEVRGDWAQQFKRKLEESLGKWEEAELKFLSGRNEWEKEAQHVYADSEGEWAKAYEQLRKERKDWENEIISKFNRGIEQWKGASEESERQIKEARDEMVKQIEEERNHKERMIEIESSIYNQSRAMMASCAEGITGWYERWGEKYRSAYYYWKVENEERFKKIYAAGVMEGVSIDGGKSVNEEYKSDISNLIRSDSRQILEKQIEEWKDGYIEQIRKEIEKEIDTVTENISQYEKLKKEQEEWEEAEKRDYGTSYTWVIEKREKIDYEGKIEEAKERKKNLEDTINRMREENINHESRAENIREVLGRESERFEGSLWESSGALFNEENGWLTLAVKYEKQSKEAVEKLYEMTGSTVSAGYLNELEKEILKSKAEVTYWKSELEIAEAVNDYAQNVSSSAEMEKDTKEELGRREREYRESVKSYEQAVAEIDRKWRQVEKEEKALGEEEKKLNEKKEEVEKARKSYGQLLLAVKGVESDTIKGKIGELLENIYGMAGEETEEKRKESLKKYYREAEEYANAVRNNSINDVMNKVINGSAREASVLELEERIGKAKEYIENPEKGSRLEVENYLMQIGAEQGREAQIIKRYIEIVRDREAESGKRELSKELVIKAFENIQSYYENEKAKREETAAYVSGKAIERIWEKVNEKERESLIKEVLESYKRGIEKWKGTVGKTAGKEEMERYGKLEKKLEELLGKEGESFEKELKEMRNTDGDIGKICREEGVFEEAELNTWVLLEKENRERNRWSEAERKEQIEGTYGEYRREIANEADKRARLRIGEYIKESDPYEKGSIEEVGEWIEGLQKASAGLHETGKEALGKYIEGVIGYQAGKDVYDERSGIRETKEELEAEYEEKKKIAETYTGWQYKILDVTNYLQLLTGAEYERLAEDAKAEFEEYGSLLIQRELTKSDVADLDTEEQYIRMITEKKERRSGEKGWEESFLQLERGTQERLVGQILKRYRYDEENYKKYEDYIHFMELTREWQRGEVENDAYTLRKLEMENENEVIKRYAAACKFLQGYAYYAYVYKNIEGSEILAEWKDREEEWKGKSEAEKKQLKKEKLDTYKAEYEAGLREEEQAWYEQVRTEKEETILSEWYGYYLADEGLLYVYALSVEGSADWEQAVRRIQDEQSKEKVRAYYLTKEAIGSYARIADGEAKEWLESYRGKEGNKLTEGQIEGAYRYLKYGEEVRNVVYYKNIQDRMIGNYTGESGIEGLLNEKQRGVYDLLRQLIGEAETEVRLAGYKAEYKRAYEAEGNKGYEQIIKKSLESDIKNYGGLTETQRKAVQKIVQDGKGKSWRVEQLKAEAERQKLHFTEERKDGAYGEYRKEIVSLQDKREKMQSEYVYYQRMRDSSSFEREVKELLETLATLNKGREQATEESKAAEIAVQKAQLAYKGQEALYEEAAQKMSEAMKSYNRAVETSRAVYGKVQDARLKKRIAQEKKDWAASIYLEGFGKNSDELYRTPKEKLDEIAYKVERLQAAEEVLQELKSGEIKQTDKEYTEAQEEYRERLRKYYTARVLVKEASDRLGIQENKTREAERSERAERNALIYAYKGEEGKTGAETVAESELIRISKDEQGTYHFSLAYETKCEEKENPENPLVPIYEYATEKKAGIGEQDKGVLEKYLVEASERRRLVDGEETYTRAEEESLLWLERMKEKGIEYVNKVILASLYIKTYMKDNGKYLKNASDINDEGSFSQDQIPETEKFHNHNIKEMYKRERTQVLKESYEEVLKKEGGEEDIARYILYRQTNLRGNWEEREKLAVEEKALGKIESYLRNKENDHFTAAAVSFGIAAALTAAAFPFNLWLLIGAGAATIVGITETDTGKSFQEVRVEIGKLKERKEELLKRREREREEQTETWQEKKKETETEWEELNQLYYGSKTAPESGTVLTYERFSLAVEKLVGNSNLIRKSEYKQICSKANFMESGANTSEKVSTALAKIENYLETEKKKSEETLEREAQRLQRKQKEKEKEYQEEKLRRQQIKEEDGKKLRELALKAGDIKLSVEERKKAAEAYDLLAANIREVTKETKETFRKLAAEAWGDGSWDSRAHGIYLIEGEESLYNTKTDLNGKTEKYTEDAKNTYKKAVLASYDENSANRLAAAEHEWEIIREDIRRQQEEWKEQLFLVQKIAGKEWSKAEGKLNAGYKQWREGFVKEYGEKTEEWTENYRKFLESKENWITGEYLYAVNVGSVEAAGKSGIEVEKTLEETLKQTKEIGKMKKKEIDIKKYTGELLEGTKLEELLKYAGEIEGRGKNAGKVVKRGAERKGTAGEEYVKAKQVLEGIREELEESAGRLAAQQAREMLKKTRESYGKRLEAENRGMEEWEETLALNNGYRVDGEIRREAIVGAVLFKAVRENQRMHRYEYYETALPEMNERLRDGRLEKAEGMQVLLVIEEAQKQMKEWAERIFGKEEEGKVKEWKIPREVGEGKNKGEYGKAEQENEEKLKRLEELKNKEYDKLSEGEREEYQKISESLVTVRDGELGEHIGYAGQLKSGENLDLSKSKESNVEGKGRGQLSYIMLDFQWNSMKARQGMAELGKPGYDKRLWDDSGSWLKAPTLREVTEIALEVVGSATGQKWLGFIDDALFAGMDLGGGYKSVEQIGNELGKKALTQAVNKGVGSAVNGIGSLSAVQKFANSSSFGKVVTDMGMAGVSSSLNFVGSSAIQAMDLSKIGRTGFFDTDMFTRKMSSSECWGGVASAMVGAGVTSGLNALNIGRKEVKVDGFNSTQIGNMKSLNGLVGSLAGSAVTYGMTGNATYNLASVKGVGLFELSVGKGGVSSKIGMGGTSVNASLLINAVRGAQNWNKNNRIEKAAKDNNLDIGTSLRSQWGFGDEEAKEQLASVIKGETIFEAGGTDGQAKTRINEDGQRVISLSDYKEGMTREEKLALGITLQHEAYRDGVDNGTAGQKAETIAAVYGHTEMLLRMAKDSRYAESIMGVIGGNQNLKDDLFMYSAAQQLGNKDAFSSYVSNTYDSSEDYWKLMNDGSVAYDGRASLTDEYGNVIKSWKDMGLKSDSAIEGGLLNILGIDSKDKEKVEAVRKRMEDSGLKHSFDVNSDNWYWNSTRTAITGNRGSFPTLGEVDLTTANMGKRLNMNTVMELAGGSIHAQVFARYYDSTVDSSIAGTLGRDLRTVNTQIVTDAAQTRYDELYRTKVRFYFEAGALVDSKDTSVSGDYGKYITDNYGNLVEDYKDYYKNYRNLHYGIDVKINDGSAAQILAGISGKVISNGWNDAAGWSVHMNYGYNFEDSFISTGIYGEYDHLASKSSVNFKDYYTGNSSLGLMGNSGDKSTGKHLHYTVYTQSNQYYSTTTMQMLFGSNYTTSSMNNGYGKTVYDPTWFYNKYKGR